MLTIIAEIARGVARKKVAPQSADSQARQQAYEQISFENIKVQVRPVWMKGKGDRNTYVYKPKAKRSRMSTKVLKSKADLISLANNLGDNLHSASKKLKKSQQEMCASSAGGPAIRQDQGRGE